MITPIESFRHTLIQARERAGISDAKLHQAILRGDPNLADILEEANLNTYYLVCLEEELDAQLDVMLGRIQNTANNILSTIQDRKKK